MSEVQRQLAEMRELQRDNPNNPPLAKKQKKKQKKRKKQKRALKYLKKAGYRLAPSIPSGQSTDAGKPTKIKGLINANRRIP